MLKYIIPSLICTLIYIQAANAQVGLFIRSNSSSLTSPVQGQSWLFNSTNNTISVWNGSVFQLASAAQSTYNATVAPTSANDQTEGYSVGSAWYNTVSGNIYFCVSAATNAAVWVQTNNLGGLSIPLTQLQQGGASGGQSLIYNSGTGEWAPGTPTITLSTLGQSGAVTGQVPLWNGSGWVPGNPPGGSAAVPLSQLSQSGASSGQVAQWNGTAWAPATAGGLPSGAVANNIITYPSGGPAAWGFGLYGANDAANTPLHGTVTLDGTEPSIQQVKTNISPATNITLPVSSTVPNKVYIFYIDTLAGDGPITFTAQSGDTFSSNLNLGNTSIVIQVGTTSSLVASNPQAVILAADGDDKWYQVSNEAYNQNSTSVQQPSSLQGWDQAGVPCLVPNLVAVNPTAISTSTVFTGHEVAWQRISNSGITLTLPTISTKNSSKIYYFRNISGGSVTIRSGSDGASIDTTASTSLTLTAGQTVGLIADNGNTTWWYIQKPN